MPGPPRRRATRGPRTRGGATRPPSRTRAEQRCLRCRLGCCLPPSSRAFVGAPASTPKRTARRPPARDRERCCELTVRVHGDDITLVVDIRQARACRRARKRVLDVRSQRRELVVPGRRAGVAIKEYERNAEATRLAVMHEFNRCDGVLLARTTPILPGDGLPVLVVNCSHCHRRDQITESMKLSLHVLRVCAPASCGAGFGPHEFRRRRVVVQRSSVSRCLYNRLLTAWPAPSARLGVHDAPPSDPPAEDR